MALPSVVAADPEPPAAAAAAHKRFEDGLEIFKRGDYAGASAAFEAAYGLDASQAVVLYSWAQSERLGGRCPHAIDLYTKYRDAKITASQDEAARDGIAQCRATIAAEAPTARDRPSHWAVGPKLEMPDDALTGAGVVALVLGFVFISHANGADTDASGAATLDEFHADTDRASRDRVLGVLGVLAGAGLVGTGVYLRLHHHEVQAATDGRVVMLGARF